MSLQHGDQSGGRRATRFRAADGEVVESSSPIPLNHQIANVLQTRIYPGASPPGSRLGTERDLAESFGVSRTTIQNALQALHQEGLVDRQRAHGTFVSSSVKQPMPIALHGYLEDILLLAETGKALEVERDEVPARLRVPIGTPLLLAEREFEAENRRIVDLDYCYSRDERYTVRLRRLSR